MYDSIAQFAIEKREKLRRGSVDDNNLCHGQAAHGAQGPQRRGLVDEYRLVIRPVALGSGMPLFKDLPVPLQLRLVDSKDFGDGTAIRVYEPIRSR